VTAINAAIPRIMLRIEIMVKMEKTPFLSFPERYRKARKRLTIFNPFFYLIVLQIKFNKNKFKIPIIKMK